MKALMIRCRMKKIIRLNREKQRQLKLKQFLTQIIQIIDIGVDLYEIRIRAKKKIRILVAIFTSSLVLVEGEGSLNTKIIQIIDTGGDLYEIRIRGTGFVLVAKKKIRILVTIYTSLVLVLVEGGGSLNTKELNGNGDG